MIRLTVFLAFVVLSAGCTAQKPSNEKIQRQALGFVRDGHTTRQQVVLKLGTPASEFDNQRILTYRLHCQSETSVVSVPRVTVPGYEFGAWAVATHDLVLVFDDQQILTTHSLIDLRK